MNNLTGKFTQNFFDKYLVPPVADFGGGRASSKRWMSVALGRRGVKGYENYDIAGGSITLDLTTEAVQERFNTIVCIDTLEHVRQPFAVAENIARALNQGGYALVVAPFQWKRHGEDFFRFSRDGLWALFDGVGCELIDSAEEEDVGEGIHSMITIKKL